MSKKFQEVGIVIRQLRIKAGLTQKAVGDSVGLHSQYVSNVERGQCMLPKPALEKFIKTIKVTKKDRDQIFSALVSDELAKMKKEWGSVLKI